MPSRTPLWKIAVAGLCLAVVSTGCGGDEEDLGDDLPPATIAPTTTDASDTADPPDTSEPTAAETPGPPARIPLTTEVVGTADGPIAVREHPGDGRLYLATKPGLVVDLDSGRLALDLTDAVATGNEQGLLGMAFSDAGDRLFVSYSDESGDSAIVEYPFADGRAAVDGARTLLQVSQPYANHNGGDLHVGPDGMLWITLGDGGSHGDPQDNGENPDTLLGSILRIDPASPTDERAYGIPADNPFVDGGGRPEIWLYGVRNPWRISFDDPTGDLWVADVGQNEWEEITLLAAETGMGRGADLGWDRLEGTHRFESGDATGSIPPIYEYGHDEGCSITGGAVYRGSAIPELEGAYLFADFCRSELRAIWHEGSVATDYRSWELGIDGTYSFGVDADGEILVLSADGRISRLVPG